MPRAFLVTYCGHENASSELSQSLLRSQQLFSALGELVGFQVVLWDEGLIRQKLDDAEGLIRDYSDDFAQACLDEQIRFNPDWLRAGLFRWKPAIISHTLYYLMSEGDLLVYLDCNLEKFPCYQSLIKAGPSYFGGLLHHSSVVLFQDRYRRLGRDTKRLILENYLPEFRDSGRVLPGIWAGCIAFRKDRAGMAFVDQWLDICTIDNLAPLPDVPRYQRFSEYKWHSQEQSMLAVLHHRLCRDGGVARVRVVVAPARRLMRWSSVSMLYKWIRLKAMTALSCLYASS